MMARVEYYQTTQAAAFLIRNLEFFLDTLSAHCTVHRVLGKGAGYVCAWTWKFE